MRQKEKDALESAALTVEKIFRGIDEDKVNEASKWLDLCSNYSGKTAEHYGARNFWTSVADYLLEESKNDDGVVHRFITDACRAVILCTLQDLAKRLMLETDDEAKKRILRVLNTALILIL